MAVKKLKRGEILFSEGEASKSMYFIQRGSLRLYKKKGNSPIELGMIQSGEVVGEMGFLDGGPRSASAEALSETDLVEITGDKMQEQLKILPPWLIVLLKTVVTRLRTSTTKIKQLETASTSITYGRDGPSSQYSFLTVYDTMKVLLTIVSTMRETDSADPSKIKLKLSQIQRYSNQIMGVHASKTMEILEALSRNNAIQLNRVSDPKGEKIEASTSDPSFLESMLEFINEENIKDHTKKITLSTRAVGVMGLIEKHINKYPADAEGISTINMAEIITIEKQTNGGKEPFLADEFKELVRNKIATELSLTDSKTALTKVNYAEFLKMLRMQRIIKDLESVNESKRRAA